MPTSKTSKPGSKPEILNYTTRIAATQTVAQIQALLVRHGALSVRVDYSGDGEPVAIEFETNTLTLGRQAYRYEPNVSGVYRTLENSAKVPRSQRTTEQARRVAWRIEKSWLEANFAKVQASETPLERVMLSYLVTEQGTLYDTLVKAHKAMPAAPLLKALPAASGGEK